MVLWLVFWPEKTCAHAVAQLPSQKTMFGSTSAYRNFPLNQELPDEMPSTIFINLEDPGGTLFASPRPELENQ